MGQKLKLNSPELRVLQFPTVRAGFDPFVTRARYLTWRSEEIQIEQLIIKTNEQFSTSCFSRFAPESSFCRDI